MKREQHKHRNNRLLIALLSGTLVIIASIFTVVGYHYYEGLRARTGHVDAENRIFSESTISSSDNQRTETSSSSMIALPKDSHSEEERKKDFPYSTSVDALNQVDAFELSHSGVVTGIRVTFPGTAATHPGGTGTLTILNGQQQSMYVAKLEEIPTKQVRIYSKETDAIRTVRVNTAIIPTKLVSGPTENVYERTAFAFHKHDGSLALAVPNYRQDAPLAEQDVLVEATAKIN